MKTDNFNHAEKVLVLGAGQLGAAVLDALVPAVIERQGTVSVIVSPAAWDEAGQLRSSNHQALADAGATFLAVDIAGSAMETLADQFRGFTTVINCMGFVAGPGTQLKITRAVLAAGVPRYFPWQFGVNYDVVGKGSGQPVWDEQYDVRTLLRAQRATEWVIVSTGMFTSFLFEPDFDVVNLSNRTLHALGSWDTQVTVTSTADIGRLTTAIYLHQPRIVNEVVFVAGETTSYRQLADTVERVTQQTFSKAVHTLPALLEQLRTDPDDAMLRYRAAFARGDGVWWPMGDTWNARHQLPTQDIAGWLQTAR
ncbi:aromatic alcohol reductase [Klebsiella pneumoniae]|uniref:aromatic alcohol reductase n=1 Tax=Klebsiella pneumoniae TaxID=573 RepID=UPI0022E6F8E6|nr:aromatic alcohol reductase [Klebsiella pneumoniae]